jgi:serine/threonine protein kinase
MENYGIWRTIRQLGRGGQGTVHLATNTSRLNVDSIATELSDAVSGIILVDDRKDGVSSSQIFADTILRYGGQLEAPDNCGAVKVLNPPEDRHGYEKQLERMRKEIQALRSTSHPNVVRILDDDLKSGWFVMEYFLQKPLSSNLHLYKGGFIDALAAFRPLVSGVAEIHKKGLVHRDIKPDNVFLSEGRGLVLSDFGLVYFTDEHSTRVSSTLENVGSRDWMPGWAYGMLVEDVKPTFDVFSLGKLFWAMLSGQPKLPLWYHRRPKHDLEKLFPEDEHMHWANKILDKCVVENEGDCLPNASDLLQLLDHVRAVVQSGGKVLTRTPLRCAVCGEGEYKELPHSAKEFFDFGFHNQDLTSGSKFKVLWCTKCGHAQLFLFRDGVPPAAWVKGGGN